MYRAAAIVAGLMLIGSHGGATQNDVMVYGRGERLAPIALNALESAIGRLCATGLSSPASVLLHQPKPA